MTYYKDNKNLPIKTVETVSGEKEYRINCIKYKEGFLVKGKDLFFMEDTQKWTRKTKLFFNHSTQTYVRNTRGLIEGVIDKDLNIGWFKEDIYKSCLISINDVIFKCIDFQLLEDNPLVVEDISTGNFVKRTDYISNNINYFKEKREVFNDSHVYSIADDMFSFETKQAIYNAYNPEIKKSFVRYSQLLDNITFGIEIETINGSLPIRDLHKNGVIICKDGSIRKTDIYPPEYVTIPYTGAKGLQSIHNLCKEITKRSNIDNTCSLHIHIGGISFDRLFLVSLYKLCYKIQNDIFDIFPFFKRNEIKYLGKEKNYCKKIDDIFIKYNDGSFKNYIHYNYERLFKFITGHNFSEERNTKNKFNPFGERKWNINSRYYWINFTNIFLGKQDTIEFRIHNATTNADKITAWLYMCYAIIKYAKLNTMKCISDEPISFRDDVLYSLGNGKVINNLQEYYDIRKAYFKNHADNKNYESGEDLIEDNIFTFNIFK